MCPLPSPSNIIVLSVVLRLFLKTLWDVLLPSDRKISIISNYLYGEEDDGTCFLFRKSFAFVYVKKYLEIFTHITVELRGDIYL